MSVDVRTRRDDSCEAVDPVLFFSEDLERALSVGAERLRPWLLKHELRPLTIVVDDVQATLMTDGDHVVVHYPDDQSAGADGAVLRLTADELSDLVNDQVTPMGWLAGGTLRLEHGRLGHVLDWWLVLRSALDGTTPYLSGDVALVDSSGSPLDLDRTFTIDDDLEAMSEFLHVAGYLHLSGVFDKDEMAAISADMDAAASRYSIGDGYSWWARLNDGSDALVRMQDFEQHSPRAAAVLADRRLLRLAGLTGDDHQPPTSVEALFKPIGVAEGISDVPWHKDCSLGRHSYKCSAFTLGISVTGADATSGQLRVVAGSHRALVWPAPELQPGLDLPVVDLATATGDVTLHLSCTLHMAQPPVARPRRVLYTDMSLPPLASEADEAAVSRLRAIRESAPLTVSQPSATARTWQSEPRSDRPKGPRLQPKRLTVGTRRFEHGQIRPNPDGHASRPDEPTYRIYAWWSHPHVT